MRSNRKLISLLITGLFFLNLPISLNSLVVNSVSIVSNNRTQTSIIRQELLFETGKYYTESDFTNKIAFSILNLKNLGIFGEVRIGYSTNTNWEQPLSNDMAVDAVVTVVEKWTLFPAPYYFYDNKTGHTAGFIMQEANLFGLNQTISLNGQYVSVPDLKSIEMNYKCPRIIGSYFECDIDLFYQDFIDSAYDGSVLNYQARAVQWYAYIKVDRKFPGQGSQWDIYGDFTLDLLTNKVGLNLNDQIPVNSLLTYIGLGIGQGLINRDAGAVWGDNNYIWAGISPMDFSFKTILQHSRFIRIGDKSSFGYRLKARLSPAADTPLGLDSIRGIKLGEVRGNYVFYGNFELRSYILSYDILTPVDIYIPLFFDFGCGFRNGDAADLSKTIYTMGTGLRFYPKYLGTGDSALRLDAGIVIPSLIRGDPFADYFYFGFSFSDYF